MFERYTEKARRTIFFGRHEASEFGYEQIEADFLLLGLARENPELTMRWLGLNYAQLRESLAQLYPGNERIATSVDLPLSNASKRALAYASEEADRLGDRHIGTEHLFLGLLREGCAASKMLKTRHQNWKGVRKAIAKDPDRREMKGARSQPPSKGLQMKFVTEDGEEIAVIPWQVQAPRIGEAIRFLDEDGAEHTYRILDLCWSMKDSQIPSLRDSEILLIVREEQP